MTSEELIGKIRELRQIKPRKDWVLLTKSQILPQEKPVFTPFFIFKPVYSSVLFVFFILFVLFGTSQTALPGDFLYPIKKITEKAQVVFVSETEKPKAQLEMANKRLEELTKIAQTNQVKKIAPALQEYQASVSAATKKITKISATTSDPLVIKEIVAQTQKLEENKERLEKTYGIAGLEVEEESNPTKAVVEWLIKDLEKRTLTEEDQLLFEGAKEDFENGNYSEALIKILNLSQK